VLFRQNGAGFGDTVFADDLTAPGALVQVIGPDNCIAPGTSQQAVRADIVVAEAAVPVDMFPAERFVADTAGHRVIRAEPFPAHDAP
jgi:hypothetical protein